MQGYRSGLKTPQTCWGSCARAAPSVAVLTMCLVCHTILWERPRQDLLLRWSFSDAAKVFDTVWRDGMLDRLWDIGVRGRLRRIFRIYTGVVGVVCRSQTSSPLTRVLHRGCHPHCMPFSRMHCYRICMQDTAWKVPLPRGFLHCCTLMIFLALHSQRMACKVTWLILALGMHVGIGMGQCAARSFSTTCSATLGRSH